MKHGFTLVEALVVVAIVAICSMFFIGPCVGAGAFGPDARIEHATVTRVYVDVSGSGDTHESHYMVATDKGVFEVNNSWLMGIWNADEIYGRIQEKRVYNFDVKGRKIIGPFFQYYPYIKRAECVATNQ